VCVCIYIYIYGIVYYITSNSIAYVIGVSLPLNERERE
jgi:hypothetical protein